jgi:transposase-like protein
LAGRYRHEVTTNVRFRDRGFGDPLQMKDTKLRSSKYFNNMIKQNHQCQKSHITPMLRVKIFKRAAVTISVIGLPQRIRKGQSALDRLDVQS